MNIIIGNKIEIVNPPAKLIDHFRDKCSMINPVYSEAMKAGRSTWGVPRWLSSMEKRGNTIIVPRGCLDDLRDYLPNCKTEDRRVLHPMKRIDTTISFADREFQNRATIKLLRNSEGMLKSPAGSGKTVMGLHVAAIAGQPTLWLTHLDRLFKQVIERIKKFIPSEADNIGVIREGKISIGDFMTVGMIDSIRNIDLKDFVKYFGMILIDEAHHVPAYTFQTVVQQFYAYYIYGLTATDYRNDGLDPIMFSILGNVKSDVSYEELVEAGQILRPNVKVVKTETEFNIPPTVRNIYQYTVKKLVDNKKRNDVIVGKVLEEAKKGEICIVVSLRRKHCRDLHKRISALWPGTGLAIGDIKKKEVDAAVTAMEQGDLTILVCTYEMLGEGFDLDTLSRLFFVIPFRAESRVEQGIGRIQRIAEGKSEAVVYEFLDERIDYCVNLFHSRYEVYKRLGVETDYER